MAGTPRSDDRLRQMQDNRIRMNRVGGSGCLTTVLGVLFTAVFVVAFAILF